MTVVLREFAEDILTPFVLSCAPFDSCFQARYRPFFSFAASAPLPITIRVDAQRSNAYAVWQSFGSLGSPTRAHYAQLEAAAQLALLKDSATPAEVAAGTATLNFPLPRQAVSLLVLIC